VLSIFWSGCNESCFQHLDTVRLLHVLQGTATAVLEIGKFCSLLTQFNKSNNAINASFTIVGAVGFASAMGACHFLNKQTTLQNDLW
jgi:hypothetical protein